VTSITQTQLTAPPLGGSCRTTGRHPGDRAPWLHPREHYGPGSLPEQVASAAFLLDVDLFVEGHQPLDAEELARQLTVLHDQIDRFFRWSLTLAGEEYFGLEEMA